MIALQQTAVGDYRQHVLSMISQRLGPRFRVYAGKTYFDPSTVTRISLPGHLRLVRNVFLPGRMLWQFGSLAALIRADHVILELNPRILSVWATLLCRRVLGKDSALWGHAWPRVGKGKGGTRLRDLMARIGGRAIAYTKEEKDDLEERLPGVTITAAPNALYSENDIGAAAEEDLSDIVQVGRLVPDKKPLLSLQGFKRALPNLPERTRLRYIGAGPEIDSLKQEIRKLGLADRVDVLGHVGDLDHLRAIYASALLSVSPGFVGLSLIQSLSFGVPMAYADNEPHAPEVVAARLGVNAEHFRSDDPDSMAHTLVQMFKSADYWRAQRPAIAAFCAANFSVERMADGLIVGSGYAQGRS